MKKYLPIILISILTFGLLSCENNVEETQGTFNVSASKTTLMVGEEVNIVTDVKDFKNNSVGYLLSEEGKEILEVSSTGRVKALKEGKARVRVYLLSNEDIFQDLAFDVYDYLENKNEHIKGLVDTFRSFDLESGVSLNGTININLGTLLLDNVNVEPIIPFTLNFNNLNEEFSLYINFNLDEISITSTMVDSILLNYVKGKIISYVCPEFLDYISEEELNETTDLDIYYFGETFYYIGLKKNFNNSVKKTYAFQGYNLEEKLNFDNLNKPKLSILNDFDIYKYVELIKTMLDFENTENSLKISLKPTILSEINKYYESLGVGGDIEFDSSNQYATLLDGLYLPDSFSEISFTIDNSYSDTNYPFNSFILEAYGIHNETPYNFLNVTLSRPTQLLNTYFNSLKNDFNKIYEASLFTYEDKDIPSLINEAQLLKEEYDRLIEESLPLDDEFIKQVNNLKNLYNSFTSEDYRYYLLSLMNDRLLNINIVEEFNITYSSLTLNDTNNEGTVTITPLREGLEVFDIKIETSNSDLIKVDGDRYYSNGAVYTGNINNLVKERINTGKIKLSFKVRNENGDVFDYYDNEKTVTYLGLNSVFPTTLSSFNQNSSFNLDTRELTLSANQTFDINSLIKLPDGADLMNINYESTNLNLCEIDEKGIITTKDLSLSSGLFSGIKIHLNYLLNEQEINETLIMFVRLKVF